MADEEGPIAPASQGGPNQDPKQIQNPKQNPPPNQNPQNPPPPLNHELHKAGSNTLRVSRATDIRSL